MQSAEDFCSYSNENLRELDLRRCLILPPPTIATQFPSLRRLLAGFHFHHYPYSPLIYIHTYTHIRLSFSAANRLDHLQVMNIISSLPSKLCELWIEVPGCLVDVLLTFVAMHLPTLTWLRVVGSHESGSISMPAMEQLG